MVAWNLWLFAISEIWLQMTQYLIYINEPSGECLTGSKWFIGAVSVATIGAIVQLATLGLGIGQMGAQS